MSGRHCYIVNPAAAGGRGASRWRSIVGGLPPASVQRIMFTHAPGEAEQLAREAASSHDVVVAVGGDGTVRETAAGLLAQPTEAALGIIPIGTGNDLASQTGLATVPAALQALKLGSQKTVDTIEIEAAGMPSGPRTHAVVYAAAGIAGEVLRLTTPTVKRWFGRRGSYTVGFLRAWWNLRAPELEITCLGETKRGRFLLAAAGNAEVAGGGVMRLSPGASLQDGELNVTVAADMNRLRVLRCFLHLLWGTHPGQPGISYRRARELVLVSPQRVAVQADGELLGETPARFRVRPGSLRLMAPVGTL